MLCDSDTHSLIKNKQCIFFYCILFFFRSLSSLNGLHLIANMGHAHIKLADMNITGRDSNGRHFITIVLEKIYRGTGIFY